MPSNAMKKAAYAWATYVAINLAVFAGLFYFDSTLTKALSGAPSLYGISAITLWISCIVMYFVTATKDPGYGPYDPLPQLVPPAIVLHDKSIETRTRVNVPQPKKLAG